MATAESFRAEVTRAAGRMAKMVHSLTLQTTLVILLFSTDEAIAATAMLAVTEARYFTRVAWLVALCNLMVRTAESVYAL